jgi:hypothetical protein
MYNLEVEFYILIFWKEIFSLVLKLLKLRHLGPHIVCNSRTDFGYMKQRRGRLKFCVSGLQCVCSRSNWFLVLGFCRNFIPCVVRFKMASVADSMSRTSGSQLTREPALGWDRWRTELKGGVRIIIRASFQLPSTILHRSMALETQCSSPSTKKLHFKRWKFNATVDK